MEKIREFFKNDKLAANLGCEIKAAKEGYAQVTMTVTDQHLNAGGACQGGAIFTLADFAMAIVTNSHGLLTVTTQCSISYIKGAKVGDTLTAEAIEVVNHHKLPFVEIKVTNQNGDLIAAITGQCYRKDIKIDI